MPRLALAFAWLAITTTACMPAHRPAARRVGMVASIAGVVGLMATAVAQPRGDELMIGFSVMSGGGVVTFALAELSEPPRGPRAETETQKLRRWAKILTERAAGAAREGKCPRVRRLEKRVHLYDREIHDFVFMRDPEIVRCLEPGQPGAPAPVEPGASVPLEPGAPAPLEPGAPAPLAVPPVPLEPGAPAPLAVPPVPADADPAR